MQQHGSTSNHSGVAALLAADDARPANIFSVNAAGPVREGTTLSLGHPMTGGRPALILGGAHFTLVSDRGTGCLYRKTSDTTALVRRVHVENMERPGKNPLPLLVNPTPDAPIYLHVDVEMHLPEHVHMKERFWCGIVSNDSVVAYGGTETLVRFTKDCDAIDICYKDGGVRRVARQGDKLTLIRLSVEQQADVRIAHALNGLTKARLLEGDASVKQRDMHYHQLAAVAAVGGCRSSTVLDKTLAPLISAAQEGDIRPQVKAHIITALGHSPAHALLFHQHCVVGTTKKVATGGAFGTATSVTRTEGQRSGAKPSRVKKLAERAERDRQARAEMRGKSGEQNSGGNKGRKNKR